MFLRPSYDDLSDFFYRSLNLVAIPKIRVSIINVVTQAKTTPGRGTLSKKTYAKEVKRRNLASSSVLYSFRLQAVTAWRMSALIKFSSSLSIKDARISVSRNRFRSKLLAINGVEINVIFLKFALISRLLLQRLV